MTAVCKSAIFHLRNIPRARRYLTAEATETDRQTDRQTYVFNFDPHTYHSTREYVKAYI